jgi:hypothetical protein
MMQRRITISGFSRLALLALASSFGPVTVAVNRAEAADANVLQGLYAEGLKSFYGADYTRAGELLTTAIDAGSNDPRSYYFRGLSRLRLGKRTEADADFKRGAELEGKDFDAFFNVSRSIERIQGSERLMLERYRTKGRKNALAELEAIRFERFRRFQPGGASPPPTAEQVAPAAPADAGTPASTAPAAAPNPFGAPAASPATPEAAPAAPAAPANPFGGPATPAAPGAAAPAAPATPPANPFGT